MKAFGSAWPILKKLVHLESGKKFYKHTKVHKNLRGWVAIFSNFLYQVMWNDPAGYLVNANADKLYFVYDNFKLLICNYW